MNVTMLVLKNGTTIVSHSEEMDHEPRVHLIKPHTVSGKTKVTLTPWPEYTDDDHILLRSDDLLTVCEPQKKVVDAYKRKVGNMESLISTPEPVILNEDSTIDEDYEPRYYEE